MEKKVKKSKRRNKDKMYALLSQWNPSSQSRSSFCRDHGLGQNTFSYWYKKYKGETSGQPVNFVALEVSEKKTSALEGGGMEISYPNGVCIRLEKLANVDYLTRLIKIGV